VDEVPNHKTARKPGPLYCKSSNTLWDSLSRWPFFLKFSKLNSNFCKGADGLNNFVLNIFIYRRPTLYPLEIAVDILKSL
jgi:hypothetical protein